MRYVVVLSLLIISTLKVLAIVPVEMNNDLQKQIVRGKHLQLYIDSTNQLTASEVINRINQPNLKWQDDTSPNNGGILGKNLWMYFEVTDNDTLTDLFYMEIPDFHVSHSELFVLYNDGTLQSRGRKGYAIERSESLINYKNPIYIINPSEQKGYLLKMNSSFGSSYKIYISNPIAKINFGLNEYLYLGAYYGVLLIMLIYNFLTYIITKDRSYLHYVIYVATCIWYSFFTDGLGFQYLWSAHPEINGSYSYASFILLFAYGSYATYFLKLNTRLPFVYKMLIISFALYSVVFVFNKFLYPIHQVSTWTFVLPYVIIVLSAIFLYVKGYRDIRFFILAYGALAISVIIYTLMTKGLFPDNFFGVYAINIGFLVEVIFLSFAQGDRIRLANLERFTSQKRIISQQKENEILKEKVNKELETLVNKRTEELQVKNQELITNNEEIKRLNDQINLMNAQLDKNVWHLQKEVKNTTKLKIVDKNVSYEEFLSVFPTDFMCYKHLESLKWGNGYICKKCANDKWSSLEPHLSRKCTKCDYNEGITAATLFHRLKIPVQKAFYIAIVVFKGSPITTVELAKQLDLRLNTCADFRKKVSLKMENEKPKSFDELLV